MATTESQGLPSHMTKCLPCCACSCCHYSTPECIGCVGKSEICCWEGKGMACKPIKDPEDPDTCCVFGQSICVTHPCSCYGAGGQCCCLECFCSLCCKLDALYDSTPRPGASFKFSKELDKSRLYTWSAVCCCISNYYCKFPECCGCTGASTFCCIKESCSCCMCCGEGPKVWSHNDCACVKIKTCVKSQFHCWLMDTRTAIPCDSEHPCILTFLGFTMCNNFACKPGCCVKYLDAVAANPKEYCGGGGASVAVATTEKGL